MNDTQRINFVNSVGGYDGVLYKYMGNIDYALDAINNKNIFMARPSSFNDPFDCSIKFDEKNIKAMIGENLAWFRYFSQVLTPHQIGHILELSEDTHYSSLEEVVLKITKLLEDSSEQESEKSLLIKFCSKMNIHNVLSQPNNIKVSCFSKTNQSIPMWAYYANSHQGVCLEYDMQILNQCDHYQSNLKKSIQEVTYTESFNLHDIHNPTISFQKSAQWAHEKECRIVCETVEDFIDFPCLKSIFVGVKANRETRMKFTKLADKYQLNIFFGKVNTEDFKIDFIDFKKYRNENLLKMARKSLSTFLSHTKT